jgi:hypothetical protein
MTQPGLFIYPWNFAEEGVPQLVEYVRGLGVKRLYLTSAYHAGFFLHPHGSGRRVRMLEDGVVYFRPHQPTWGSSVIQPVVSELCEANNLFGEICQTARQYDLEVSAWTVCLHNTRLGLLHPESTIHNVYGDSYPHALTPADPAARDYVIRLVADLAKNYPLHSILLEAPDYRGRAHGGTWVTGHHHERTGLHLRELEESLLDISFNPADVKAAQQAAVDVEAVRVAVRSHLDKYFNAAPAVDEELADTLVEFRARVPELVDYEAHFRRSEASLLDELKTVVEPTGVKLVTSANHTSADIVFVAAYGESIERIARITRNAKQQLAAHQQLVVGIRLGFYSPGMGTPVLSEQELSRVVDTAISHGADTVALYNYGEAPRRCIEWIRQIASVE